MLGHQLLRQRNDILGLGAKEADGLDKVAHTRFAKRGHFLRCVC